MACLAGDDGHGWIWGLEVAFSFGNRVGWVVDGGTGFFGVVVMGEERLVILVWRKRVLRATQ